MQNHPSKETLKAYILKGLSLEKSAQVILHIDSCDRCLSFISDHPLTVRPAETVSDVQNAADDFHLDADRHIFPYLEGRADDSIVQLVDEHVLSCDQCAFILSDLENARPSIPDIASERDRSYLFRFKPLLSLRYLTVPIAAAALLIVFVAIWKSPDHEQLGRSATSSGVTEYPVSSGNDTDKNASKNLLENQFPRPNQDAPVKVPDERETAKINKTDIFEGVPTNIRENVIDSLRTGSLRQPEVIRSLRADYVLRSDRNELGSAPGNPNGIVTRSTMPVFRWRDSAKGQDLTVKIYSETFDLVQESEVLNGNHWRPSKPLERGKIYSWEVSSDRTAVSGGRFKVLSLSDERSLRSISENDLIRRAVISYYLGLLEEARSDLEKAATGPSSSLAKKMLRQLK